MESSDVHASATPRQSGAKFVLIEPRYCGVDHRAHKAGQYDGSLARRALVELSGPRTVRSRTAKASPSPVKRFRVAVICLLLSRRDRSRTLAPVFENERRPRPPTPDRRRNNRPPKSHPRGGRVSGGYGACTSRQVAFPIDGRYLPPSNVKIDVETGPGRDGVPYHAFSPARTM